MSVSVAYRATVTVTEVIPNNTGSATAAKRTVTHDEYDEAMTLNAASTPPCTLFAGFLLTLIAGAATISLRALTGTNAGAVDGNGLKLQVLRIKNLGANIMTFTEGVADGYAFGGTIVVPPGGHCQFMFADGAPDIATGDKNIDVAGTGTQTAEITILMG